jgi:hypothetical protein
MGYASPDGAPRDLVLPVAMVQQGYNAGCGLAAICMALNYHGVGVGVRDLEQHPLVLPRMLRRDGLGPGRLGRIALSYGCRVQIVDPCLRDVGVMFVREGGSWRREPPSRRHILEAIATRNPVVACIPDKAEAFDGCNHHGSHWITIRGIEDGDVRFHDPAPWRRVDRCKPGYWESWRCSMIVIGGARAGAGPGPT